MCTMFTNIQCHKQVTQMYDDCGPTKAHPYFAGGGGGGGGGACFPRSLVVLAENRDDWCWRMEQDAAGV